MKLFKYLDRKIYISLFRDYIIMKEDELRSQYRHVDWRSASLKNKRKAMANLRKLPVGNLDVPAFVQCESECGRRYGIVNFPESLEKKLSAHEEAKIENARGYRDEITNVLVWYKNLGNVPVEMLAGILKKYSVFTGVRNPDYFESSRQLYGKEGYMRIYGLAEYRFIQSIKLLGVKKQNPLFR